MILLNKAGCAKGEGMEPLMYMMMIEKSKTYNKLTKKIVIEHFPLILKKLLAVYPNLSLKLSPNLSDQTQFTYIKGAQTLNISATIVDEAKAHSPYGIVVHSDKAENLDKILFSELYPDILAPKQTEQIVEKRGFFTKLFGK